MIAPINNQPQVKPPCFKAKINSPILKYSNKDFFIRIRGYGKNKNWANTVKQTADAAVILMQRKCSFDNIMRFIIAGTTKANQTEPSIAKKELTGILRAERDSYKYDNGWKWQDLVTCYEDIAKYKGYSERLNQTIKKTLKNPYPGIDLTIPIEHSDGNLLKHGNANNVNDGLDLVEDKFYKLISKYKPEKVSHKNLNDINNRIAEIRWLLAHITPWARGSDAISNIFMRALYKTFGIKTYPPRKGISFDMEAFCTNLNEYKKNFPTFFTKPPRVVE